MKNFVLLIALFTLSFSYGQRIAPENQLMPEFREHRNKYKNMKSKFFDISEKQAFEKWKNSNIRKQLEYEIEDFDYIYFKENAVRFKTPISKMILLNSSNNAEFREWISGNAYISSNPNSKNPECDRCNLYYQYTDINKAIKKFHKQGR